MDGQKLGCCCSVHIVLAGLIWGGSSDHTGDSIEAARLRSQALRDLAANGMFPRLVVRCGNKIDIDVPSSGFRSGSNPRLRHTGVVLWSFPWTNLSLGDLRPLIFGRRSALVRKALRPACALSARPAALSIKQSTSGRQTSIYDQPIWEEPALLGWSPARSGQDDSSRCGGRLPDFVVRA